MDRKLTGEMGMNQEHAVARLAASLVGYANTSIGRELPSIERLEVMAMGAKRFILAVLVVDWMMALCTAVPDLRRATIHLVSTPDEGEDGQVRYDFDVGVSCVESNSQCLRHYAEVEDLTVRWMLEDATYPTFVRELLAADPNEQVILPLTLCRESLPWDVRETQRDATEYFRAFREASPRLAHDIVVGLQFGADVNKVQDRARDRPRAA
ncbi:hypothetical protein [Achromobacter anxifer]|uniref:hypothetical protein n=1 Tax=Achromobacter anxifer TaxID=1287737 RepID=UPI0023F7EA0A|nr:hypothetical protein [Achromobacter anxifer]MDF8364692.1 hypothetical protein [Achromobacter anxifer]